MTVANIETIGSSEYLLALALNQRVEPDVSEPYNSYSSFFS